MGQVAGLTTQIYSTHQGLKEMQIERQRQQQARPLEWAKAQQEGRIPGNLTNPGGALADIKRSSIDGDEPYFMICPNGMGYEKD